MSLGGGELVVGQLARPVEPVERRELLDKLPPLQGSAPEVGGWSTCAPVGATPSWRQKFAVWTW